MLPPIPRRPKPALAALSAMLLTLLPAAPSPAQTLAAPHAEVALGRAVERITPAAATVLSTAHYQATLSLGCNSSAGFCVGYFPAVSGRHRLNLTRMSCYMRSSTYATYATGKIGLEPDGALIQYLPADHSTEWGHHVLNRAIDVQVTARKYISVALLLASGGQATDAVCTVSGTLETLQ